MTTVVVTGVDTHVGTRVADQLAKYSPIQVIGLGRTAMAERQYEVLPLPTSARALADFLQERHANVVLHLDFVGNERPARDNEAALQHNILGTMSILGACVTAKIERVIIQSSTLVYGASLNNPAFIKETRPLGSPRTPRWLQHYADIETVVADFAARYPTIQVVTLRCAELVGAGVSSTLTRYLKQKNPPVIIGFNPRIQVLHPDDAATAFALAATNDIRGALNLAADPVVTLNHAIRLTGHQPAPIPSPLLAVLRKVRAGHWPYDEDFLRFHCVASTERATTELGWKPAYRTEQVLQNLVQ